MQGYTFDGSRRSWVCSKCAALVDDPQRHEASHQELIMVFTQWANILRDQKDVPAPSAEAYTPTWGTPSEDDEDALRVVRSLLGDAPDSDPA